MANARTDESRKIGGFGHAGATVSDSLNPFLEPGAIVRHPERQDWGLGQVQSNIGGKITVNFEHEGKVVIDGARVELIPVFDS